MRLLPKMALAAAALSLPVLGQVATATTTGNPARLTVSVAVQHDTSQPLRQLATGFHVLPGHLVPESPAKPVPGPVGLADTVQQTSVTTPARAHIVHNYDGLGDGYPGFTVGAIPPD